MRIIFMPTYSGLTFDKQPNFSSVQFGVQPTSSPAVYGAPIVTAPNRDVLGITNTAPQSTQNNPPSNNNLTLRQQMEQGLRPWDDNLLNSGAEVDMSSISEAYQPLIDALSKYEGDVQGGFQKDSANIKQRGTDTRQLIDSESAQLTQDNTNSEDKFNRTLESGLQSAIRAYNALRQQGNARFGGGNSAGQAVGELAQQEFFRQQGEVQQQGVEGSQQFASERGKIGLYISQKKTELDGWLRESLSSLESNLTDKLAQIAMQKGTAEANKTKDRLAILQQAQSTAAALKSADIQMRQGIIATALTNMQQIAGRAFTPAEIAANYRALQNELMPSSGNLAVGTPQGTTPTARPNNGGKDEFDELRNV